MGKSGEGGDGGGGGGWKDAAKQPGTSGEGGDGGGGSGSGGGAGKSNPRRSSRNRLTPKRFGFPNNKNNK